jgi:hypothetical protein
MWSILEELSTSTSEDMRLASFHSVMRIQQKNRAECVFGFHRIRLESVIEKVLRHVSLNS